MAIANVPITSLPVAGTVSKTDQLLVQGNSTQRATLAKILSDLSIVNPDMAQDTMLRIMVPNGAGAHNATCRGKNLGGSLTSAQAAQISAGTFQDLYLGDYWSIGGVDYIIVAFDYWLNTGDTPCTKHHIVVITRNVLYTCKFNPTNTSNGGYVGSDLYKNGLTQAKQRVTAAFGSAHILNHRELLVNAVTNGAPTGTDWYDSTVELMNENMVYGGRQFSPMPNGATDPWSTYRNYTIDKSQLPLFRYEPWMISDSDCWSWLRDVVSDAVFACVSATGEAATNASGYVGGVRPVVGIC